LAVFRDERMVGTLSPEESVGLTWITNPVRSSPVTVDFPDAPQHVSVEILRAKTSTKVTPDTANPGNSRYLISITGEGNIQELASFGGAPHPRPPNEINHAMSEQVAKSIRQTVRTVQKKYRADVFGFGELYREAVPAEVWTRVGPKWSSYFPNVRIDVEVMLAVRRRGLTLQP
jgi:spore germination protein KC